MTTKPKLKTVAPKGYFVPWSRFDELFANLCQQNDARHEENIGRFAKIDHRVQHLQNAIDSHVEADAKSFVEMRAAITENTELTKKGADAAAATQASVEGLVSLYKTGQGVWKFGKWLRTVSLVMFGIAAGFTGTYLFVMYWLGRGPLPPLH